jgi:hypothetical protein
LYAYPTGITGVTRKNSSPGCTCHNPNPSSFVAVAINGPDELAQGETARYSVEISGGPLVRGGTDIAASSGTLDIIGSDLQKISDELTHTLPKAPLNNVVTFDFNYTAPSEPGEITLYANGNSVNFNGSFTGDAWNFAPDKIVNVTTIAGVTVDKLIAGEYRLSQNYPNPFNPETNFEFRIADFGFVSLKIYDIQGNEVAVLANEEKSAGEYRIKFNAAGLSSGIYFYQLNAGSFMETKKMMLLK